MVPKSYYIAKWAAYSAATLLLMLFQQLVLGHIRILGVVPFLYPVLPAVLAALEGSYRGAAFALGYGLVCDLLLPGPFEGMYVIAFTLTALLAGFVGEKLIAAGFLQTLTVSALAFAVTGALRLLAAALTGGGYLLLRGRLVVGEALFTLPALLVVAPVYRFVRRRTNTEY